MKKAFPFNKIIITFPTEAAAKSSKSFIPNLLPLEEYSNKNEIEIKITSDPCIKLGSGGGTFAAFEQFYVESKQETTLIIHAGGDSSRCPSQMVVGKAWTSIPKEDKNATALLITALGDLFQTIPPGSLVISASDCILDLKCKDAIHYSTGLHHVLGVAVPAPLSTAKNHGVYVTSSSSKDCGIQSLEQVLQKPTIDEMKLIHNCCFDNQAWIDTGIVAFLPPAVQVLHNSIQSNDILSSNYTHTGIQALLQKYDNNLVELKKHVPSVDLYTHVLHAFQYSKQDYLKQYSKPIYKLLFELLHELSFDIITIPNGSFVHLGTTLEFMEYVLQNNDNFSTTIPCSILKNQTSTKSIVIYNTIIEALHVEQSTALNQVIISNNAVLEHCQLILSNKNTSLKINSHSLITCVSAYFQFLSPFNLTPANMLLHQIPLTQHDYIWVFLGIHDNIKASPIKTLYNIDFQTLLHDVGLCKRDLFDEELEKKDCIIWNARLHVVQTHELYHVQKNNAIPMLNELPFQWITDYIMNKQIPSEGTLSKWKNATRYSLCQIQALCRTKYPNAAPHLLQQRQLIQDSIQEHSQTIFLKVRKILLERLHEPIPAGFHFNFIREILLEIIHDPSFFDVSSRAFMILSSWCIERIESYEDSKKAELNNQDPKENHLDLASLVNTIGDVADFSLDQLKSIQLQYLEAANYLTRLCIQNDASIYNEQLAASKKDYALANAPTFYQCVTVTAPARIDLAGGWSDTPPISYEYGGSVTNVSVTIDNKYPFMAKCTKNDTTTSIKLVTKGLFIEEKVVIVETLGDLLNDVKNPLFGDAVLLKASLICLGLVPMSYLLGNTTDDGDNIDFTLSILPFLQKFLNEPETNKNVGLEIISISNLPLGSGMGGSSILGGACLTAIATVIGYDITRNIQNLIHSVLSLEQIITTGGGWQDQIGGCIGGFKCTKSIEHIISPISLSIEYLSSVSEAFLQELQERLVLVYTGKSRLAKNILQNVLMRWNKRTNEIMTTIEQLISGSIKAKQAIVDEDIDGIGHALKEYWEQKKIMAASSGDSYDNEQCAVEPTVVSSTLKFLYDRNEIVGGSLCGAGGGGFMVLLARKGRKGMDLRSIVNDNVKDELIQSFSWHTCEPVSEGLIIQMS